jgi:hypothetical protein
MCMHKALAVGLLFIQLAVQTSASGHGEQRSLPEMIACMAAVQTAYLQQMHVRDIVMSPEPSRNAVKYWTFSQLGA